MNRKDIIQIIIDEQKDVVESLKQSVERQAVKKLIFFSCSQYFSPNEE